MTDRQLQFRVGLFVLASIVVAVVMVFQFGEFKVFFAKQYEVATHFEAAPGVLVGSPVRMNGIPIGAVRDVILDHKRGGVLVMLQVDEKYKLRADSVPMLQQSLLGDTIVEFSPGKSEQWFDRKSVLEGTPVFDLTELARRTERHLSEVMTSLTATSREWQLVARNVNGLVETNRGNLGDVIERTAVGLDEFTKTMSQAGKAFDNANRVIGDEQTVNNLKKAVAGLPQLVTETQQTITTMRSTVGTINSNLRNLDAATQPIAKHTTSIVMRLDQSLANMESLTGELKQFAELANKSDGSLRKFISDPTLYRDLERSAATLSVLLQNLDPVIRDMHIFSDKVARRPELIGVGGALRPSSGLKDDDNSSQEVRPAGFQRPGK